MGVTKRKRSHGVESVQQRDSYYEALLDTEGSERSRDWMDGKNGRRLPAIRVSGEVRGQESWKESPL